MLHTHICKRCGKPFEARTKRRNYCAGECFRANECEREKIRRLSWSSERRAASNLVWNAIWRGDLIRRPCEVCGKPKADAHHDDYSRPLVVRWLCRTHHRLYHIAEARKYAKAA